MNDRTPPEAPGGAVGSAAAGEALEKAFKSLAAYDWGQDPQVLSAIDDAVLASRHDTTARRTLELRFAAVLGTDVSPVARSFVCRRLAQIGSKDSVPALSRMLGDADLSHMARYALERIPCPEAVKALRDALSGATGRIRIGIINSIGARRDVESAPRLIALLDDSLIEVAAAAAAALGQIATPEAARALLELQRKASDALRLAAADAGLVCADRLRDAGLKDPALELYEVLSAPQLPDHIRYAASAGRRCAASEE